jgi:hypothetical protein
MNFVHENFGALETNIMNESAGGFLLTRHEKFHEMWQVEMKIFMNFS